MSNETEQRPIHCHVVLTSGAKPRGRIQQHGPAQQQLRNFTDFAQKVGVTVRRLSHDHVRSVQGLGSFQLLGDHLERRLQAGAGAVFIDDLNRLVRACPLKNRHELLLDLAAYGDHLFCVRQGRLFSGITVNELNAMQLNPDRGQWHFAARKSRLSAEEKRDQTRKAAAASRIARGETADAISRDLAAIRDELSAGGCSPTFATVADEANRRDLRTSRGNEWNSASVSRMMKRLDGEAGTTTREDNSPGRVRSA